MNVLVTGGAGYIGSHAVRELLNQGFDVTVYDDLRHGHRAAVDPRAHFVRGALQDDELLNAVFQNEEFDAVMHFAAYIEVGESVADPAKYYANNFSSALILLMAMIKHGIKRFVFSSTAAVYGNPLAIPIPEDHPLTPVNPYGRSKMMVELALSDFSAAYGLGYAVLRYFNVAGAAADASLGEDHQPETHLIPRVLSACMNPNEELKIFGTDYPTRDGTCVRDYIHVQDLARAHVLALLNIRFGRGEVFNLGSENGFTVREVIDGCAEVTATYPTIIEYPRRSGDPAVLVASSAKIRKILGWRPQYPELKTILRHAWNWHRSHPNGYRDTFFSRQVPGVRAADLRDASARPQ